MANSGVAASHQVVKAGWMQRESDVLRRWKRCYCVLKSNGVLTYFNDETQMEAQGAINLPRDCYTVKMGKDVGGVSPPHSSNVLCLLEIRSSQANAIFCAESVDDAQTWKLVFDDIIRAHRVAPVAQSAPPMYGNPAPLYGAPPTYYAAAPAPVYAASPAPVTVVTPGSSSRVTSTTYYSNGQSVSTVRRSNGLYPVQQTVYTYPGQTYIPNGNGTVTTTYHVPNQTTYQAPNQTTHVYQTRYY